MTRIVKSSLAAAVLLGLTTTSAHAWNHFFTVWTPEQQPVEVYVADDGAPNSEEACEASENLSGCCEESVPAGYCQEAADDSFEKWEQVPCTELEVTVFDGTEDPKLVAANERPDRNDGLNTITFNDPGGELIERRTLARANYSSTRGQQAFLLNGQTYYRHAGSVDIVFNDTTDFVTNMDIEEGRCSPGDSHFEYVMTHEIGHFLGMAHTCEENEACPDDDERGAIMYWTTPEGGQTCSVEGAELKADDIDGITALYGPSARFSCSHQVADDQVVGTVPLELKCVVVSDFISEITSARWAFGDGGVSDDISATHTYTEPGNYTIQVDFQGTNETCGDGAWENSFRRVGYVRVCDVPAAEFTVEKVEGLSYQLLNESNVSVFGCISDIQWDVFEGEGTDGVQVAGPIKAWEPIVDFERPGTYTAVMSLGGIGGTGGAVLTFDVTRAAGDGSVVGCSSTGAAGGAAGGLLVLAGLLFARRRRA